jgi:hypothetical protein
LPKLPTTLLHLRCKNNQITYLRKLPATLINLKCKNNQPENNQPEDPYENIMSHIVCK